jgi:hypothetical protein
MSDFSYTEFYKMKALELAEKVRLAAEQYKNDPESTAWCELENRFREWHQTHAAWRAMACHKL